MFKLLIFVLLSSLVSVYATGLVKNEKVEVYSTSMDTKDNIIKAYGEVIVVYKDYHLSADKAVYNKNTGILELFDNVIANQSGKNGNGQLLGDYAKLNISQKERSFKPFYMIQEVGSEELWISGCESVAKDVDVDIKSGVLSGCNPVDPLWTMEFSSAEYNTDSMWLDLYNARIYIDDIPVFYTPYFGYSLNTKRRTGVLTPMLGLSSDEGFYYTQSLYIAESNWWDLEIIPQIRTTRGNGVYSTFRWVDSAVSKGSFTYGVFKEKDSYLEDDDNSLANKEHYGFNFNYEHEDFINHWFGTNLNGQSGVYIDIDDMNDVEYLNLSSNNLVDTATATQVYSRANLFYNDDNNYYGTYFKYYKDLELENNDKTIQNIPSLHYHRYLGTQFDDHFLYNLNLKSNNYYRQEGKNATQTNLNVPLALQTSLFDEYLNISYTANLYGQHTTFSGDMKDVETTNEDLYEDGHYLNNSHAISISSQLTKAYENITHVIDIGTLYTAAGTENRNGYYDTQKDYCSDPLNKSEDICEYYNVAEVEDNIEAYFSQYIYDKSGKQIIYHRIAQNYLLEDTDREFGEIENELYYNITDDISYYNNMFFNYYENGFSKNFNSISYDDEKYTIGLSHMYQDSFINPTDLQKSQNISRYTNYMTSNLVYRQDKHYTYNFRFDYDLELNEKKSIEVGFIYKKKCWDFGMRYVENNRPTLDENGNASSRNDRFIYFTIALKPIIKSQNNSGFVYKLPE